MIRLHHYPSNASFAPHVLLHELGVPFERVLVDRTQGAHKSAAYLALNPNGLIPVLQDDDLVLYESAAICLHLCDRFPQAGLAPAVGTAERAHFYKWLIWMTNTLQARLMHYFYPDRLVEAGNIEGARQVKAVAEARIGEMLQQIDEQLAHHGQAWLLGERFSAVDAYGLMLCRWTRGFAGRPARDFPHIGPWLQRLLARPAVQQTVLAEQLTPPLV
jgi:glutathione S-transferase